MTNSFALDHAMHSAQGCTALLYQLRVHSRELTAHVKHKHCRRPADSAHMRDAKAVYEE